MKLNKIVKLKDRLLTVQAGSIWDKIQRYLDKLNLSVSEMQSYNNFSVGGSISVNCHGRGMQYGTLVDTIKSMKVVTSDGKLIYTDRKINPLLFKSIIGGYGGIAIVVEVTLIVCDNYPISRKTMISTIPVSKAIKLIKSNPKLVFYNANIYPTKENEVVHVTWNKTEEPLTDNTRLQKKYVHYWKEMIQEQLLRRLTFCKFLRAYIEPKSLKKRAVVWRNFEMSYDTNTLEPLLKYPTTSVLQEYFVPVNGIDYFLKFFWEVMNDYKVNILNVSLRYVHKTDIPILNYAPEDRIAVVLYLNIGNNDKWFKYAKNWSQHLIQKALDLGGTYYLPYLPFATKEQFQSGYPNYNIYKKVKNLYDPNNRLSNRFIEEYINTV